MKYYLIIPAAGIGTRMGADTPKQYLKINNKTILEYALDCFLSDDRFEKVVIVLNENDQQFKTLKLTHPKIVTCTGGAERCHSVLNGLLALQDDVQAEDWILVHDAARPCLQKSELDKLIDTLKNHPTGGLLGVPMRNTVKRVNEKNEVVETVDRNELWQALTPQMFRYKKLYDALRVAIQNKVNITDDAAAIELIGEKPLMIAGDPANIKITQPIDLFFAENYLKNN